MLVVTEAALEHLADLLERRRAGAEVGVRVVAGERGWAMRLDRGVRGDETIAHAGRTVLVLGSREAEALAESTLDVEQARGGRRLVLRAPG